MAEHTSSSITIEAAPADVMGVIADWWGMTTSFVVSC